MLESLSHYFNTLLKVLCRTRALENQRLESALGGRFSGLQGLSCRQQENRQAKLITDTVMVSAGEAEKGLGVNGWQLVESSCREKQSEPLRWETCKRRYPRRQITSFIEPFMWLQIPGLSMKLIKIFALRMLRTDRNVEHQQWWTGRESKMYTRKDCLETVGTGSECVWVFPSFPVCWTSVNISICKTEWIGELKHSL